MSTKVFICPEEMRHNACETCGLPSVDIILQENIPGGSYMFLHTSCLENTIRDVIDESLHKCPICGQDDRSGVHGTLILGGGWSQPPEYYCTPDREDER